MLLALLMLVLAVAQLPLAAAHGFLALPESRNYIHSTYKARTPQEKSGIPESFWNYCPHCLAAGLHACLLCACCGAALLLQVVASGCPAASCQPNSFETLPLASCYPCRRTQ